MKMFRVNLIQNFQNLYLYIIINVYSLFFIYTELNEWCPIIFFHEEHNFAEP